MDQQPKAEAALDSATIDAWNTYNDGTEKPLLTVALPYEAARRSAAFHEAGHAVVTAAYGAHIKVTGVVDLPAAVGGWALTGRTEFDGPPIGFWRYAAQSAAGECAQARYLKAAGLWSPEARPSDDLGCSPRVLASAIPAAIAPSLRGSAELSMESVSTDTDSPHRKRHSIRAAYGFCRSRLSCRGGTVGVVAGSPRFFL